MKVTKILYIGGFELPDKNAAAQRVIANAKSMRELGCTVVFINSLKSSGSSTVELKNYYGFECYEMKRKGIFSYSLSGRSVKRFITEHEISAIIAYNYPGVALGNISRACKKNGIKCYVDVTEWYKPEGNLLYRLVKGFDIRMRMERVQPKTDGIIAISRFLYDYYKSKVDNTVLIPPLVDMDDIKWKSTTPQSEYETTSFVYAGSPSKTKERLDLVIEAIIKVAKKHSVSLSVIGVTKEEYERIYGKKREIPECVHFFGRIPHTEVIELVKKANWSVIIRDNNSVVKAGFPTKLVESISCGTPVIANDFSNIKDYLNENNSLIIGEISDLAEAMNNACVTQTNVDCMQFDYRHYLDLFRNLLGIGTVE